MEDAHGLNYRLVIFPILRWNQEDSLRHVGRHYDTKGELEIWIQKWISGQQQNNIDIYKRNFLIMVGKRD